MSRRLISERRCPSDFIRFNVYEFRISFKSYCTFDLEVPSSLSYPQWRSQIGVAEIDLWLNTCRHNVVVFHVHARALPHKDILSSVFVNILLWPQHRRFLGKKGT